MDDKGRLIMPLKSGNLFTRQTFKETGLKKPEPSRDEGNRKERLARLSNLKKVKNHAIG